MSSPPDDPEGKELVRQPTARSSSPNITTTPGLDPAIIQKFLQVAELEAEVRLQEISVEKQGRADAHDYSKRALNAQAEDRKDQRAHGKSERRDRMVFAGAVIVVLAALLIVLIYMGQAELAKQIASYIGTLVVGVIGGYNYGVRKGREKKGEE